MIPKPDLSICIISTRTLHLLRGCLRSIYDTVSDLPIEVLVVNNSADPDSLSSIQQILAEFPQIQLIQNEQTLGFGTNHNTMMRRASGRYLMPLNDDTIIQSGALQELVAFMDRQPQYGMAGPKLIYGNGKLQPSCRNFPNAITHFFEASALWKLLKGKPLIGRWYYLCGKHDRVREVDWVTGACLIIRAEVARQTGYYNAEMFPIIYGEDLEWCWRLRQAGWKIMFDPAAVIVHLENQTPLSNRAVKMYRGFYDFCVHYYSRPKQISIRVATWLAVLPRWLMSRTPQTRTIYMDLMKLKMKP